MARSLHSCSSTLMLSRLVKCSLPQVVLHEPAGHALAAVPAVRPAVRPAPRPRPPEVRLYPGDGPAPVPQLPRPLPLPAGNNSLLQTIWLQPTNHNYINTHLEVPSIIFSPKQTFSRPALVKLLKKDRQHSVFFICNTQKFSTHGSVLFTSL